MKRVLYLFSSFVCAVGLLAAPLSVVAEGLAVQTEIVPEPPIILTEIQTGAATASDEFIELYNRSGEAVDIAGWQLRYVNSTTTSGETTLVATITPVTGESLLLESGAYFVLHTASVTVPAAVANQTFSAALSKSDKTVALFARDETLCQMTAQDAVAWEAVPGTTVGEGPGVVVASTQTSKEKLLQRFRDSAGQYVDTNHNSSDFVLSTTYSQASPGSDNAVLFSGTVDAIGAPSSLAALDAPNCVIPEPEDPPTNTPPDDSPPSVDEPPAEDPKSTQPHIPAGNLGLKSPQLSELLPNPGSPLTDAQDEFIELYNPNDAVFDLSGYMLEVGTTTKRHYTLSDGTLLQAKTFLAFFSSDTGLALSNTGGQVRLIDPLGQVLAESDQYAAAKDNQSWILANGAWQWSTKPTPNAINMVSAPLPKQTASKTKTAAAVKTASKSKTSNDGTNKEDNQQAVAATVTPGAAIHSGVLALVAACTLLYGAYEYRHDVANKIRKFRQNRADRRHNRPGA